MFDINGSDSRFLVDLICVVVGVIAVLIIGMPWLLKSIILYLDWVDTFVWTVS